MMLLRERFRQTVTKICEVNGKSADKDKLLLFFVKFYYTLHKKSLFEGRISDFSARIHVFSIEYPQNKGINYR